MSFYKYVVKKETVVDPMYGAAEILQDCGDSLEAAYAYVKERGQQRDPKNRVFIEKREYVSKRNVERDFPLYATPIWSAGFHGYESLKKKGN